LGDRKDIRPIKKLVLLILGEERGAKLARFSWKIPGGRYVKIVLQR